MTWQDRTREAAYTSPGGARFTFDFVTVDRSFEKNGTAYTFPGVAGTYVQDTGSTGRRYPMRAIFWGDDHDLTAEQFAGGLRETGRGKLEHPRDGKVDVVPLGPVTFREDLVRQANQTVVEVEFWESNASLFPSGSVDPASAASAAVAAAGVAAASAFAIGIDTGTATERVVLRNRMQAALNTARGTVGKVAELQANIQREFDAVADSIQEGLNVFLDQPLALALQTKIMLDAPARLLGSIGARLDAYSGLTNVITDENNTDSGGSRTNNDFRANELHLVSAVGAALSSAINTAEFSGLSAAPSAVVLPSDTAPSGGTVVATPSPGATGLPLLSVGYKTRTEAIEAAIALEALFATVNTWREQNYASLGEVDTGEAYQALQQAVALTVGVLVETSFTLRQERRVVLSHARTIVELVAELYGSVDDQLDFFISTNDLSGDEIVEIPAGREVVYYA